MISFTLFSSSSPLTSVNCKVNGQNGQSFLCRTVQLQPAFSRDQCLVNFLLGDRAAAIKIQHLDTRL